VIAVVTHATRRTNPCGLIIRDRDEIRNLSMINHRFITGTPKFFDMLSNVRILPGIYVPLQY
jgi:hypothetical protein